jgi:xanthine dehydrogenase accessory factor
VYYAGSAAPDTREPNPVDGVTHARVLRAPSDGEFLAAADIGQRIRAGQSVGTVAGNPVVAQIDGVLRGLLATGMQVTAGLKVGDIDPRANPMHCRTISDKARAVGGGVLEALLHFERASI